MAYRMNILGKPISMEELETAPNNNEFFQGFMKSFLRREKLQLTNVQEDLLNKPISKIVELSQRDIKQLECVDVTDKEMVTSAFVKEDILNKLSYLSCKFKNLHKRKLPGVCENDFQEMSDILIKYLPKFEDPCSKIDHILYKNGMLHEDKPEKEYLIDPVELLANIDIHDISYTYNCLVNVKNTVNQCFDIAFLKLVKHKGKTWRWHLDRLILEMLNSKIIYKICIGLKIFKTGLTVDEFKHNITPNFCSAASDLSTIPEMVNVDDNEMAKFVARHAKECHDFIAKKGKLDAYRAYDIFMAITDGCTIRQCQIRALYEIMKSGESSELYWDLHADDLECTVVNIVHTFLCYLRDFDMMYCGLDEEMREIDKHNGQEFGGFSLKIVADGDMKKKKKKKKKKPLCASDGLEKSTLNKYFFYDDAMKTLSMLSFLYNCVENFDKDELQHFKVKSYVTQFVITLIHQRDLNNKIDKPIWIMEKILNTCHFLVFDHEEKKEKDVFLKLMRNDEQIDEEELICLKDFMKKNKLSYEDEKRDYEYH